MLNKVPEREALLCVADIHSATIELSSLVVIAEKSFLNRRFGKRMFLIILLA